MLLVILTVTSLSVASLLQMFRPRTIPVVEPATVYIVLKVPLSIATSAIVKTLKVLASYFSPYSEELYRYPNATDSATTSAVPAIVSVSVGKVKVTLPE